MPRKKKTATRRGNNEGSIYQRKDGLWVAQVIIGKKADGAPDRKGFSGKTRAEVATKMLPYLKNTGQVAVAKDDVTIEKHMMFWLMNYKFTTVTSRTFERCIRNAKKHILPVFGRLSPQDLSMDHIQPYFKTLLNKYALDSVKKIKFLLGEYLDYCTDRGIIAFNPVAKIKLKTRERKTNCEQEEKSLPKELHEPFFNALNTDPFMKAFCLTELFVGLRPGEVIPLKWKDYNRQELELSIMRGITTDTKFDEQGNIISRETVVGETKTEQSVRRNPIPETLAYVLNEWYALRKEQEERTGYPLTGPNDYIFGTNKGEFRTYYGTKTMFDRFLKKNGLQNKGIHFYELRHTFSNTLFEEKTNPRFIQALMGHTKIETTMIYDTVRKNDYLHEAVKVFNEKFGALSQPQAESEIKLQTEEELGKRVAAFMKKYNIENVEEVLEVFKDDKLKSPITMD